MNPHIFCTVCGGAYRPGTRSCALECHKLVYETRRWRQYKRALALASILDQTPHQIAYNIRREAQYRRNLYDRARKAFVCTYYREYPDRHEPSVLWVVPRRIHDLTMFPDITGGVLSLADGDSGRLKTNRNTCPFPMGPLVGFGEVTDT